MSWPRFSVIAASVNTLREGIPTRSWCYLVKGLTVIFCYNAACIHPFIEHYHPFYTPLHKVSNEAVKQAGLKFSNAGQSAFRKLFSNLPGLVQKLGADGP
jgi:hypothetical protein